LRREEKVKRKNWFLVALLIGWLLLFAGAMAFQAAAIVTDEIGLDPLATALSGASSACHQMTGLACPTATGWGEP